MSVNDTFKFHNIPDIPSHVVTGRSRGSSVGIVSDYGLDDRGSISDTDRGFFF
jgi:hypothetical protein